MTEQNAALLSALVFVPLVLFGLVYGFVRLLAWSEGPDAD